MLIRRDDDAEAGDGILNQNHVHRLMQGRAEKQWTWIWPILGILGDRFTLSDHGQNVITTDPALEHTLNRVAAEDHRSP